jgi:hypothetical protein
VRAVESGLSCPGVEIDQARGLNLADFFVVGWESGAVLDFVQPNSPAQSICSRRNR